MIRDSMGSGGVDSRRNLIGVIKPADHDLALAATTKLARNNSLISTTHAALQHNSLSTNVETRGTERGARVATSSFGSSIFKQRAIIIQNLGAVPNATEAKVDRIVPLNPVFLDFNVFASSHFLCMDKRAAV